MSPCGEGAVQEDVDRPSPLGAGLGWGELSSGSFSSGSFSSSVPLESVRPQADGFCYLLCHARYLRNVSQAFLPSQASNMPVMK